MKFQCISIRLSRSNIKANASTVFFFKAKIKIKIYPNLSYIVLLNFEHISQKQNRMIIFNFNNIQLNRCFFILTYILVGAS